MRTLPPPSPPCPSAAAPASASSAAAPAGTRDGSVGPRDAVPSAAAQDAVLAAVGLLQAQVRVGAVTGPASAASGAAGVGVGDQAVVGQRAGHPECASAGVECRVGADDQTGVVRPCRQNERGSGWNDVIAAGAISVALIGYPRSGVSVLGARRGPGEPSPERAEQKHGEQYKPPSRTHDVSLPRVAVRARQPARGESRGGRFRMGTATAVGMSCLPRCVFP
jgi:hypothetical protein